MLPRVNARACARARDKVREEKKKIAAAGMEREALCTFDGRVRRNNQLTEEKCTSPSIYISISPKGPAASFREMKVSRRTRALENLR